MCTEVSAGKAAIAVTEDFKLWTDVAELCTVELLNRWTEVTPVCDELTAVILDRTLEKAVVAKLALEVSPVEIFEVATAVVEYWLVLLPEDTGAVDERLEKLAETVP